MALPAQASTFVHRCSSRSRLLIAIGLAPVLFLLAAGCSDQRGEPAHAGYDIGSTSETLRTKCGSNKYHGLQGADVSEFQSSVNWRAMRRHGIVFAYARVSYGTGHIDPYFSANWRRMKSAGVLRGAYQFFLPSESASAQAHLMVRKVGKLGSGDLPCMIDVEVTDGRSASTIASEVGTWLRIVKKGTGKTPVIYTGAYFWQDSVRTSAYRNYPLWIAAYGPSCPALPTAWHNWQIWQYCDGQRRYCRNGSGFDRDVFNGSKASLLRLAGGSKTLKAKAVRKWSNAKRFHGKAADYLACAGQKFKFTFTFKNIGTAVWRDVKGRGSSVGSDVFLVTTSGKKDRLTDHRHYSVRSNKNSHVRGDRNAPNCNTHNGCRQTTFVRGGMIGHAPNKPGIYKSRWRLRDFSKHWGKHSHGFGPKVQLSLKVVSCKMPSGSCGCRVWCSNGKSHQLSSNIQTQTDCTNAARQFCRASQGNSSLFVTDFNACSVPSNGSGGAGGNGGAADQSNSIGMQQTGDNSVVQDNPGYSDYGFTGGGSSKAASCSVAAVGHERGAPLGFGALMLLFSVAELRRRRRLGSAP